MNTVTVKIRDYTATWEEGVLIGQFTPDAIDGLLRALEQWTVMTDSAEEGPVAGQFVVTSMGAWYEILVGGDCQP